MLRKYAITVEMETESDSVDEGLKIAEELVRLAGFTVLDSKRIFNQRTLTQNSALHKWFSLISLDAKEKGLTVEALIAKPSELPITETIIKDCFKKLEKIMLDKSSTTELNTVDFGQVVEAFSRIIAQRLDCSVPFPSIK